MTGSTGHPRSLESLLRESALAAQSALLERMLAAVREQLGMEVAVISQITGDRQIHHLLEGDGESFGFVQGESVSADSTYCRRMIEGHIPPVIQDARADERVCNLPITHTARIGAYVGVPLRFSDGRLFGTLCCLSHEPDRSLGERDVRFMRVFAHLIAEHLEQAERVAAERRRQTEEVQQVLSGGSLRIALQPIVCLWSRNVVGYEALARVTLAPERGPDAWLAEASAVGLEVDLELAAVQTALATIDRLPPEAFLSINASPQTLLSPALPEVLASAPRERLVLELTEHAEVRDYQELNERLADLRETGIRLAIDDAGAGFASFRHILRLSPDIIKLDMSLSRDIHLDPARRALASSLITFANEIKATITAEGIESRGELDTLAALGVTWGQGFYLAPPEPVPVASRDVVARRRPPPTRR